MMTVPTSRPKASRGTNSDRTLVEQLRKLIGKTPFLGFSDLLRIEPTLRRGGFKHPASALRAIGVAEATDRQLTASPYALMSWQSQLEWHARSVGAFGDGDRLLVNGPSMGKIFGWLTGHGLLHGDVFTVSIAEVLQRLGGEAMIETMPERIEQPSVQAGPHSGMSWLIAMGKGERHVKCNGYPGLNALAGNVGCSSSTMSKAIKRSPYLRARKAEHESERTGQPRKTPLTGAMLDNTVQSTEADPAASALKRLTSE